MLKPIIVALIDQLYQWITTFKSNPIIKDTSRTSCKFDLYIDSALRDPLSLTIFELSNKGELIIDDPVRVSGSEAAFFLFVNEANKFMIAVKNTTKNQGRLIRQEPVDNYKVKIVL